MSVDVSRGGKLIQFILDAPSFKIKGGLPTSRSCERIETKFKMSFPSSTIIVSKNCLEGKQLFDELRPYFSVE